MSDTAHWNPTQAIVRAMDDVLRLGSETPSRNGNTKELLSHHLTIFEPDERVVILPHRNDNIFAKIAETLWVIGGRSDLKFLQFYLPRAFMFSDNGRTWRGGYGPRLRHYCGCNNCVDQVEECLRLLNDDNSSRRAVMSLFDPSEDYVNSKDIPCNNWLHWLIRDGRLSLNVAQRSSDVMWGFSGINLFEWSVLQEMMANWTNTVVGRLDYYFSSLHLYEQHYERAEKVVKADPKMTVYEFENVHKAQFQTGFDMLGMKLETIFVYEETMRKGKGIFEPTLQDEFLQACWDLLKIFYLYKTLQEEAVCQITEILESMPLTDLKVAAVEYLTRGGYFAITYAMPKELIEILGKLGVLYSVNTL